jgi:hypothetical protein
MQRRSIIVAAAVVAGLSLGAIVGPSLSGVASAQTTPTETPEPGAGQSLRELFLDRLAAALGIQRSALDGAIAGAGSDTLDEAVRQGTLTQEQADRIEARLQAGDLGALWGGRGGPGGPGGPLGAAKGAVHQAMLAAAAGALNTTPEGLLTALRNGDTLAGLASAAGTTQQAVVDAALAAARTALNEAVTAGTLTQEQANATYAQFEQRGADLFAPPGPGGRGGRGFPGGRPATETPAPAPDA